MKYYITQTVQGKFCGGTKCIHRLIVSKKLLLHQRSFTIACIINVCNTSVYIHTYQCFVYPRPPGFSVSTECLSLRVVEGGDKQISEILESDTRGRRPRARIPEWGHRALQGKDQDTQGMTRVVWMGLGTCSPELHQPSTSSLMKLA